MSKLIKLYTLSINFLYVNYISIKWFKKKKKSCSGPGSGGQPGVPAAGLSLHPSVSPCVTEESGDREKFVLTCYQVLSNWKPR